MHQTHRHSPVCPVATQVGAFRKVCLVLILQLMCSLASPLFKLTPNLFTQKVESSFLAGQVFFSPFHIYQPEFSTCDNWTIPIVNDCVLGERPRYQSVGALPDCREVGDCSKSSVGLTSFLGNMQSFTLPSTQHGRKLFLWLTADFQEMHLYFWTLHLEFQLIF